MKLRSASTLALLTATAMGALLTASAVHAQDYTADDQAAYQTGPGEEVIVTAPRYHPHYPSDLSGHIQDKTTLSTNVRYDDLDLTTRGGAHELRARVRDAAADVCGELADRYPYKMADGKSCYRDAVGGGLNRANEAIHEARYYGYDGY